MLDFCRLGGILSLVLQSQLYEEHFLEFALISFFLILSLVLQNQLYEEHVFEFALIFRVI